MALTVLPKTFPIAEGKSYVGQTRPGGGGSLPSWVPAVGTIANVGLNAIRDIDSQIVPMNYSGSAIIGDKQYFTGAGHTDGPLNGVIEYDHNSRLYSVAKPSGAFFQHASSYVADDASGWNFADTTTSAVQVGESAAYHAYCNILGLPPNVIPNTPKGALVKMGGSSLAYGGQIGTKRIHVLAIGETLWTNPFNLETTVQIGSGCTMYDSFRGRVVMFPDVPGGVGQNYEWWEINTPNKGVVATSGITNSYYANCAYMVADDLYALFRQDSRDAGPGGSLRIIDPKTSAFYTPTVTGTLPTGWDCGLDWVESARGFTCFAGSKVYFYKAPSNPRTGTWVCSLIADLTGTVSPNTVGTEYYSRTRYIESKQSIAWPSGYNAPMQYARVALP